MSTFVEERLNYVADSSSAFIDPFLVFSWCQVGSICNSVTR